MDGQAAIPPDVLERGDGAAEIGFARRGDATRLSHLYQKAPCRVLSPLSEPGEPVGAVVVTTSGGLADGDRLRLSVAAGADTSAQVTTQAAEKVYRAHGPVPARFDCGLTVGEGAWLEWLPQETILFEGARLARTTRAEVAPGGRMLACEHIVFGRIARGEHFAAGSLFDRWEVARGGDLLWCDALDVSAETAPARAADWGFANAEAIATAIYVADDAPAMLDTARAILGTGLADGLAKDDLRAGATVVNGLLLARWLGAERPVRTGLSRFIAQFRAEASGYRAVPPHVWTM